MQILNTLLRLSFAVMAVATPVLEQRATCSTPEGSGTCIATTSCGGMSIPGHCAGPANIQCCVVKSCATGGTCKNTSKGCAGGSFHSGLCPGDSSIQCCEKSSGGVGGGGSGGGIVSAARHEEGIPYVYGGGNINGPTSGGFDCSGLTQYSIHKATGKTIPRTADQQYYTGAGHHIPRSAAQPGDLIFWARGGACGSAVEHVGIFERPGFMVNAAHPGTAVREQSIWTSSGGLSICPDAVRFW